MHFEQNLGGVFAIGPVAVAGRAVLAPLSGVTDVAFRRIALRFGTALVVSEMVASDEYVRGAAEARIRAEGEGVTPHVVQLAGCDPRWMGEAARLAEARAAAVMVGRAAVGRPWLVGRIAAALAGRPYREPSAAEKTEAAVEHYEDLLSLFGRDAGLRH